MLFGLHFMSHFTLYNAVRNTHAIQAQIQGGRIRRARPLIFGRQKILKK